MVAIAISIFLLTDQVNAQDRLKPTFDASEIDYYKQQLTEIAANGNNQFAQQSLSRNLSMAERDATQYALLTLAPKNPNATPRPLLSTTSASTFPTGIFNHGSSSYKPSEVTITTAWQGIVNGNYYQVEVGSIWFLTQIRVLSITKSWPRILRVIDMGRVLTPGKTGMVTLQDEKSLRLILRSEKGMDLYFDVQSRICFFFNSILFRHKLIQNKP